MFGFGFPGFAGFPPRPTDTLHSPANTLPPLQHTHLENVWNIKQGMCSIFVDDEIENLKVSVKYSSLSTLLIF